MGEGDPSEWQLRMLYQMVDAMGQEGQTYYQGQFQRYADLIVGLIERAPRGGVLQHLVAEIKLR